MGADRHSAKKMKNERSCRMEEVFELNWRRFGD
jgi:hypothetical protein